MKTIEQQGYAYQGILKLVEQSPVTFSYRGVNDKDQPLYECKNRSGIVIADKATEPELRKMLRGEKSEVTQ
ncbi:MAG: hypothetical protein WC455_15835 [Dehalococcoidia bacterium]|jgi:hypothetical protein